MKTFKFAVIFLFSTGCASTYQPKGFTGGYYDYPVGKGKLVVGFEGNGYTSPAQVRQFTYKRALEVCTESGFSDYKIASDKSDTKSFEVGGNQTSCYTSPNYINCQHNKPQTINKPTYEIMIECL